MVKTYFMVDIESDGPIPGKYSMMSIGAVVVDEKLDKTFYADILPISDKFEKSRLKFLGLPRNDKTKRMPAKEAMASFLKFVIENTKGKPVFISDNNGYDWMFVCWYFWEYLGECPFGFSSYNLQSLYKGYKKNISSKISELREKKLSHNALEDARDNAKIFLKLMKKLNNE